MSSSFVFTLLLVGGVGVLGLLLVVGLVLLLVRSAPSANG